MSRKNGIFYFAAIAPMSSDITIHDDRYTADSIVDGLKEGILEMQAGHHDDFIITKKETGEEIATVDNINEQENHLNSFEFISDD